MSELYDIKSIYLYSLQEELVDIPLSRLFPAKEVDSTEDGGSTKGVVAVVGLLLAFVEVFFCSCLGQDYFFAHVGRSFGVVVAVIAIGFPEVVVVLRSDLFAVVSWANIFTIAIAVASIPVGKVRTLVSAVESAGSTTLELTVAPFIGSPAVAGLLVPYHEFVIVVIVVGPVNVVTS